LMHLLEAALVNSVSNQPAQTVHARKSGAALVINPVFSMDMERIENLMQISSTLIEGRLQEKLVKHCTTQKLNFRKQIKN